MDASDGLIASGMGASLRGRRLAALPITARNVWINNRLGNVDILTILNFNNLCRTGLLALMARHG